MNLASMLGLGNWEQQPDISHQRNAFDSLRREMKHRAVSRGNTDLGQPVAGLEKENDDLRLYLASLVRYLGNKGTLQKEEFCSIIDVVDAEDGTADSRHKGNIMK